MSEPESSEKAAVPLGAPMAYLVDDEVFLIELGEAVLRSAGFATRTFRDAENAWQSFVQEPAKPSLLMTDYAMGPGMSGLDLAARCKAAWPGLKVLLVSGSATPELVREQAAIVDGFVTKPYTPDRLLAAARRLVPV
jgi:DNA-binding NtrC family response regulator